MQSFLVRQMEATAAAKPAQLFWLGTCSRRWPFLCLFLLGIASNATGSAFSILYNNWLIVRHYLDAVQTDAFWSVVLFYNVLAYPACVGYLLFLLVPLARCHRDLLQRKPIARQRLQQYQRRVINLPFYQICINLAGWLPGALVFPLGIALLGGWQNIVPITIQFVISFVVSALLTTIQTIFIIEAFLFKFVYPTFFREDRPAEVEGAIRLSFRMRLSMYWMAVALVPLLALLVVAVNCSAEHSAWLDDLRHLALGVAGVGMISSGIIGIVVGRLLFGWMKDHEHATAEISAGNYDYRIPEKRPDEFGRLTDRINDLAAALGHARQVRETVGQFVRPDVLDKILERYPGLGGEVEEITVFFIDIRGFTRRSSGESPEQVVALLNAFFTLTVAAIEECGGLVNKFLGDGLMALFGVPQSRDDHADWAVQAALDLLVRLREFNRTLAIQGQEPLSVGIGIHTGPALVGCIGATVIEKCGRQYMRREFTAIGETINLGQRLEQLTKTCGGPILLSESTQRRLGLPVALSCLGVQEIEGYQGKLSVYRVEGDRCAEPMLTKTSTS